jgi:hypothetical protein
MSAASHQTLPFAIKSGSTHLSLAIDAFICLFRAWAVKLGKDLSKIHLPPVAKVVRLSSRSLEFAVTLTDMMVTHGARWTGRKCFFRTFILACLLRKRGVPVAVNVGLCDLKGGRRGRRMDGHCWLTLNGEPCLEEVDRRNQYPHFLAEGLNGVRYWAGFQPVGETGSPVAAGCSETRTVAAESISRPISAGAR